MNGKLKKKLLGLATIVFVLGAGCGPGVERGPAAFGGGNDCRDERVPTFEVEAVAGKPEYRTGQTARVRVKVTRSTEEMGTKRSATDDHHGGVEGVRVGLGMFAGDVRATGSGVTDETGSAIVKLKVGKPAPQGWAMVSGRAWKEVVSGFCKVTEEGVLRARRMFRVAAND